MSDGFLEKEPTLEKTRAIYSRSSRQMGANESRYRITRTINRNSPWLGFCTVVKINEISSELYMPNGEKHKFIFTKNGLQITEGEHAGHYKVEVIY